MAKRSEFTEVVDRIVKHGEELRRQAAASPGIPLMQEKLSNREARTRVSSLTPQDLLGMTPQDREALLKAVGTEAVMEVVRKGRDTAISGY